ncbi:MAG TPA: hypothetical protein PK816_02915 [Candidatus Cloacimonadota bacterium]|nr:hypothetical protein [Candidatus Cloacimonadota bacterium]
MKNLNINDYIQQYLNAKDIHNPSGIFADLHDYPVDTIVSNTLFTKAVADIKTMLRLSSGYSMNQLKNIKNHYPDLPVNELVTFITLQKKYKDKLQIADMWLLTDKNAQQASSFLLAQYHGSLFRDYDSCADLCCGIGMDLFFLSENKKKCFAVDLSEEILRYASHNMSLYSDKGIVFMNIKAEEFQEEADAVFVDPDRRVDDRRSINPFNMSPDLPALEKLYLRYPRIAIKLSPMLNYDQYDFFKKGQLQFVSEHNELKEILFCSKELVKEDIFKKAVLLTENVTFTGSGKIKTDVSVIKQYLYEPNVAIIKAHLIEALAYELNLSKIDPHLALLSSDQKVQSPFVKCYQVQEIMDFSIKKLNQFLNNQSISQLDIKTRGFSETVEQFRNKVKLKKGNKKAVLFILKLADKHYFVISDIKEK